MPCMILQLAKNEAKAYTNQITKYTTKLIINFPDLLNKLKYFNLNYSLL